jgi:hypothetical protein
LEKKEVILRRKVPILALVVGMGLLLLSTTVARAGDVSDVNTLLGAVAGGPKIPTILNDTNVSLAEIVASDGTHYITGFINFSDNWSNSGVINSGGLNTIANISDSTPVNQVDPDIDVNQPVGTELTGWFMAKVLGFGANPETGTYDASDDASYAFLAPVASGTVITAPDGTDLTWDGHDGSVLRLYADDNNDYYTDSLAAALSTTTNGTEVVDFGFNGSASTSASYSSGDEFYAIGLNSSGVAKDFHASLNVVWADSSSDFSKLGPNDVGTQFYGYGPLFPDNGGVWAYNGGPGAVGKILLLPLPSGALAGLALLGLLAFGRVAWRRKHLAA